MQYRRVVKRHISGSHCISAVKCMLCRALLCNNESVLANRKAHDEGIKHGGKMLMRQQLADCSTSRARLLYIKG